MEGKRIILVVEDDEFVRRAIERYCSAYAPTLSVATVRDALEALGQDLVAIVLDIDLPDGSGLTVLEKLRERDPALPVLIHSGHIDSLVSIHAHRHGAELLGKSGDLTRLRDFVKRAVRARRDSEPRQATVDDTGESTPTVKPSAVGESSS